ncbi:MAG TPA: glycosyltransferase, partial [Planctomycetaceae bacterium]
MQSTAVESPRRTAEEGEESPRRPATAFTVVVPAYNEEGAIGPTLDRLRRDLAGCGEWEIVVVNDGSKDRTAEVLRARDDVRVIEHVVNRGY